MNDLNPDLTPEQRKMLASFPVLPPSVSPFSNQERPSDVSAVLREFLAAHDAYIDEADEMGAGRLRTAADKARAVLK